MAAKPRFERFSRGKLARRSQVHDFRRGGFQPITASALQGAAAIPAIRKSASAEIYAGRARAVGVTKYKPPSGSAQSPRIGSSALSEK